MEFADYIGCSKLQPPPTAANLIAVNDICVGLECERETNEHIVFPDITRRYIDIKGDGSLRNNGKEYVFNSPLYGTDIIHALIELNKIWSYYNITHSFRTSDHIHVNIQNFSEEKVEILIKNSLILEPTLFNLGSTKWNRSKNPYCIPVHQYIHTIPEVEYGFRFANLPKYLGFRLTPYGSIEYRMFESTNSILEILNRINVCLELVNTAKNTVKLAEDFSNLRELFPKTNKLLSSYLVPKRIKETEKTKIHFTNSLFKELQKYAVANLKEYTTGIA